MTLSPLAGTTSAADFLSMESQGALVSWEEYEKVVKTAHDSSDHMHDFHHKHDPTQQGLSHVIYGKHVVPTSGGDQLLSIRNAAMWSAAVLSYSIHLQNDTEGSESSPTAAAAAAAAVSSAKVSEEAESAVAAERERRRVVADMRSLESGIAALHGPLEMLREGLRAGAALREKVRLRWEHWQQLQRTVAEVNNRLRQEQERLVHLDLWSTSGPRDGALSPGGSRWSSDLAAIRRIAIDLDVSDTADVLASARSLSAKLLLRSNSGVVSRTASPDIVDVALLQNQASPSLAVSAIGSASNVPEETVAVAATPRTSGRGLAQRTAHQPGRTVFSSARLKVPPGGDFRCPLRLDSKVRLYGSMCYCPC
jgi:hypothetical protein